MIPSRAVRQWVVVEQPSGALDVTVAYLTFSALSIRRIRHNGAAGFVICCHGRVCWPADRERTREPYPSASMAGVAARATLDVVERGIARKRKHARD